MATLKLILYFIILLVVITAGMVFGFRNDTIVTVDFFFSQVSTTSIGVWLLLSFAIGGTIGYLVSLPGTVGLKLSRKHHQRKIVRQQDELVRLKGEPAEGS